MTHTARLLAALPAFAVALTATLAPAPSLWAQPATATDHAVADAAVELIPREVLFGNPERVQVRLSPDGEYLSFVAPVNGVMNIWVGPADDWTQAQPVTTSTERPIANHAWTYAPGKLLYTQDTGGDENTHVFLVDVTSSDVTDLTPIDGVQARIDAVSDERPHEIILGLNDRNAQFHDLHLVDLNTGERSMYHENRGHLAYLLDDEYNVRFGFKFGMFDGSLIVEKLTTDDEGRTTSEVWDQIPSAETMTTSPAGFDPTGTKLYMLDSRAGDTAALYLVDIETKERELIFESDAADISEAMVNPVTEEIEAVAVNYLRTEWEVFDDSIQQELDVLAKVEDAEVNIASRTLDDSTWVVAFTEDDGPVKYYLYDRETDEATYLFSHRPELESLPLAPMHALTIEARDGLDLVSYLTLPVNHDTTGDADGATPATDEPLPMVLMVHGGPWARDSWGYNPYHQWLANRGYAVLSVNFRGSTGFGKAYVNAGNGEWGKAMHDDLLDAVAWAVDQGIADPDQVAIMGGSYGGYATLVGLTMTPEVFACGVDIVGPSSIITLIESVPPYWRPALAMFKERVGDWTTEEGEAALQAVSPLNHVQNIQRPLLIGQGANDPRVKQAEADQIVAAMLANNLPVTYALFPDEGHGFARPVNNMAFNAVTENFLAEHLGGRAEPIRDALHGSTIQVPQGAAGVPGLAEAIDAMPPAETDSSD